MIEKVAQREREREGGRNLIELIEAG